MSSERLHYGSALKQGCCLCGKAWQQSKGRASDASSASVRRWRNDRNSIFSCKATKCFTGPKEGRYPQVDEAVLRFVTDTCKGLPVTS